MTKHKGFKIYVYSAGNGRAVVYNALGHHWPDGKTSFASVEAAKLAIDQRV